MNKTLLESEDYYMILYRNMLKEIENRNPFDNISFPKWLKDVLLVLLCKAKPNVERKWLRKKVTCDLNKITKRVMKEYEMI